MSLLRPFAIALAALLLAWVLAQSALERFLLQQGESEFARVARGESRIGFEFDTPRDLIGGSVDGAGATLVDDGLLAAELPDGDANVRLNLRGLALDARRQRALDLRLHASGPATLHLIFDEPGELRQWTQRLALAAGWNELRIDLSALAWRAHSGDASAPWGGASGRVGEFRLHLAGEPGLRFALDHLRFHDRADRASGDPAPAIAWLPAAEVAQRLAQGVPPTAPSTRLGVLLPTWRDTPERLLALRDRVRAADADALFWPAGHAPADAGAQASAPHGWAPGWGWIGAYALLALWVRLRARQRRVDALLEIAIGHGPLLALTIGLGLAEQPSAPALAWLGCALAFQLSALRLHGSAWTGRPQDWRRVARYSVPAAVGLLAAGVLAAHWQAPGLQRTLGYLPFVLLQQGLLLGFLWPRVQRLAGRHAVVACAALFALAHAPNFALMLLSFAIALAWLRSYHAARAWLPILASHYLLGLLAISLLPPELLYSAEAGLRYFQVR